MSWFIQHFHIHFLLWALFLTRKLQGEALFAGEEVCGELHGDSIEGAVSIWGQRWTTQLPQQDPSILGTIPDPKHVMDFFRVENQEVQTDKRCQTKYIRNWLVMVGTLNASFFISLYRTIQIKNMFFLFRDHKS